MALTAQNKDRIFRKSTGGDLDTGVVSYHSNGKWVGSVLAHVAALEYNERKLDLAQGERFGVRGLNALVWWNDRRQVASLRIRPALLATVTDGHRRVTWFLESINDIVSIRRLAGYPDDARANGCGWRFHFKANASMPYFEQCFIEFMREVLPEYEAKHGAQGAVQGQQVTRKDVKLMKQVFPVLVCARAAEKEGSKKIDGAFLEGFAPKNVPAANADTARTKVIAELIAAGKYGDDIDDPDVSIMVCSPLEAATE